MTLETSVRRAADGDLEAFADVTRRFQHMAFGYALAYVRNFPDVLTELAVSDEPRQRAVTLQVAQRLGHGVVRCVAASPVSSLTPGMTVLSSGREMATPVGREACDRIVQLLATSTLAPGTLVPIGIKVIDVMRPLVGGPGSRGQSQRGVGSRPARTRKTGAYFIAPPCIIWPCFIMTSPIAFIISPRI